MDTRITIQEDRWRVARIVKNFAPPTEVGEPKEIRIPSCQRQWAWKNVRGLQKQQELIDSAMNGFPIPTCIMNCLNLRQFDIYDGRHRMETLWRYANDKFAWNGKKFSELTPELKDRFNSREIPVTIMEDATNAQLAEVFIRLNKGVPLKDYDLFWANRESPLVGATERLVFPHARLAAALGDVDLKNRNDLANWVGLVRGLSTQNAGNISTSYIRASENDGLNVMVNDAFVTSGLDALATLFESANAAHPTTDKIKRAFKKVGKLSAFFVADWLAAEDGAAIIRKWVRVIKRLRGQNNDDMKNALSTKGAQNLTAEKIAKVLRQVNDYLERGILAGDNASNDGDESE